MCGSKHDADDLVQETFAKVLKRPRLLRDSDQLGYHRTLRNPYFDEDRTAVRRLAMRQPFEDDAPARHRAALPRESSWRQSQPPDLHRDARIAVDLVGLSYREAARASATHAATITTRLHSGRQDVTRAVGTDPSRA